MLGARTRTAVHGDTSRGETRTWRSPRVSWMPLRCMSIPQLSYVSEGEQTLGECPGARMELIGPGPERREVR